MSVTLSISDIKGGFIDAGVAGVGIVPVDDKFVRSGFGDLQFGLIRTGLAGVLQRDFIDLCPIMFDDRFDFVIIGIPQPARGCRTASHHGEVDGDRDDGLAIFEFEKSVRLRLQHVDGKAGNLEHHPIAIDRLAGNEPDLSGGGDHGLPL